MMKHRLPNVPPQPEIILPPTTMDAMKHTVFSNQGSPQPPPKPTRTVVDTVHESSSALSESELDDNNRWIKYPYAPARTSNT